jgi:hypothetical protein
MIMALAEADISGFKCVVANGHETNLG